MSGTAMDQSASRFNPYQAWLGFPPNRIPANFYALFGVPLFESDRELIAHLADSMLAHIRQIRPGEHVAEWTDLLDTIRSAKEWLCDPEKKKIYDADLEAGRVTGLKYPASVTPGTKVAPGRAGRPDVTKPAEIFPQPGTQVSSFTPLVGPPAESPAQTSVDQDSSGANLVTIVWRVTAFALFVFALFLFFQTALARVGWVTLAWQSFEERLAPREQPASPEEGSSRPITPGADVEKPSDRHQDEERSPSAHGEPTPDVGDNPPHEAAAIDQLFGSSTGLPSVSPLPEATSPPTSQASNEVPKDQNNLSQPAMLGQSQPSAPLPNENVPGPPGGSMSPARETGNVTPGVNPDPLPPEFRESVLAIWRALEQRDLEEARGQLNQLAAQVRDDTQRSVVEALDQLVRDLEQFWTLMGDILASLQSTEEIAIGDTFIIVVDASRDHLVVRAAGQNRRYTLRQLPTILVRYLAEKRLQPGPDADILLAAFLAVDPAGQPGEVEQLLQRAEQNGGDVRLLREALKLRPNNGVR